MYDCASSLLLSVVCCQWQLRNELGAVPQPIHNSRWRVLSLSPFLSFRYLLVACFVPNKIFLYCDISVVYSNSISRKHDTLPRRIALFISNEDETQGVDRIQWAIEKHDQERIWMLSERRGKDARIRIEILFHCCEDFQDKEDFNNKEFSRPVLNEFTTEASQERRKTLYDSALRFPVASDCKATEREGSLHSSAIV